MFDRFSETARRAVFFSRYESSRCGEEVIGTEHLLLGVLREQDDVTKTLWDCLAFDPQKIVRKYPTVNDRISSSAALPLSESAQKALRFAIEESTRRGDPAVEPFHLVLAMLSMLECTAATLLNEQHVDYASVAELLQTIVPAALRRKEIEERTPLVLRGSHYELLDKLAETIGLDARPAETRQRLLLAIMDALADSSIAGGQFESAEDFRARLRKRIDS